MRHAKPGFTLLELMAVVGIVSVLAALAGPSLRSVVADERLLAEGYAVGGWIYDSRMLALGLKRCIRIRGLHNDVPSPAEFTSELNQLRARERSTGDCETLTELLDDTKYNVTGLPDFRTGPTFKLRLLQTNILVPAVWRPMGYLRGNADSNFSDDRLAVVITDERNKFVVITVSPFGQICTGRIGDSNPSC